jgi:hypothetical protein
VEVPIFRVFSISREHPWAPTLMRPYSRRTHSYGNLPYNITLINFILYDRFSSVITALEIIYKNAVLTGHWIC